MPALERYTAGFISGSWIGYVEYDRDRQQYRHIVPGLKTGDWDLLRASDLAGLLREGDWMLEIPPDQRLPEGF